MLSKNEVPKYLQIVNALEKSIVTKTKNYGQKLPSVNKCCLQYQVSRDTVLQAYDTLKKRGIVQSVAGKGYFIKSYQVETQKRIFVLFDEFNAFKQDLYLSLINHLGKQVFVDVYFHHFNHKVFKALIEEANGNYSHYVIMPSNLKFAPEAISKLNKNEVYLLDQTRPIWNKYASVHQDFEKDIYQSLLKVQELLIKYKKLYLIFPGEKEPTGMVKGFEKFAKTKTISCEVVSTFSEFILQKDCAFIVVKDDDLVELIESAHLKKFQLKKEYGIISYNDTSLKKIVEKGITTISTNFKKMGETMANMILQQQNIQIHNPCDIIIRSSL
jgi:DNA-binding transcriptional regulator YhcF (GntR family)